MLYLCATPIGNLEDVTLRVLAVLREVDLIACEDTRRTAILLRRYDITAPTLSLHEHNEEERLRVLLPLLREGKRVAVVSDAGMPTLSDPGLVLVRACYAEGLPVTVLPGPSAITAALCVAGIPAARFAFVGFLPRGAKRLLEQLAAFDGSGAAVVAFESPRRLRASLEVIAQRWPDRELAVCRELTKVHEEVIRGTAAEVLACLSSPVRGEIVVVLAAAAARGPAGGHPARRGMARGLPAGPVPAGTGPAGTGLPGEERLHAALTELEKAGVGTKKAATIVGGLLGLPAREVYRRALAVKTGEKDKHGAASSGE